MTTSSMNAAVSKTVVGLTVYRGFESLPFAFDLSRSTAKNRGPRLAGSACPIERSSVDVEVEAALG